MYRTKPTGLNQIADAASLFVVEFSDFRKNHPPIGRNVYVPKRIFIDYQSITTLARRWLYT